MEDRRVVEIPKAVRDNFEIGEQVIIKKIEETKKNEPDDTDRSTADKDRRTNNT